MGSGPKIRYFVVKLREVEIFEVDIIAPEASIFLVI